MSLVEVRFLPEDATTWIRAGATLLEAADAAGVDLATGCEEGMCGTDCVGVEAPEGGLAEPLDHERGSLERMGLDVSAFRLACSAKISAGPITVRTDAF